MCIVIVSYAVYDVINFEIYYSFFIKPFSYVNKKLEQKLKYFKKGKSFQGEIKSIFHHF